MLIENLVTAFIVSGRNDNGSALDLLLGDLHIVIKVVGAIAVEGVLPGYRLTAACIYPFHGWHSS